MRLIILSLILVLGGCDGVFSTTLEPEFDDMSPAEMDMEADSEGSQTQDMSPNPSEPVCGNGVVEEGELCDAECPVDCEPRHCQVSAMSGSSATCDVACAWSPISECVDADGCCPAGCTSEDDSDCASECGNGVVEVGETCDGDCPVTCDDANACTVNRRVGTDETCTTECIIESRILTCVNDDGCCPTGCTASNDSDCNAVCDNGMIEPGETCDGNCPTSCDDGNACTERSLMGSAAACTAFCQLTSTITACIDGDGCCPPSCNASNDSDCNAVCGNAVVEPGELCDSDCPALCDDNDVCTANALMGSAATCNAMCVYTAITACVDDDGCCPAMCNETNDSDCSAVCGNGIPEAGELCDGDCPTSCNDNVACTVDSLTGASATCNAQCNYAPITACANADGCCPPTCNATNDDDCAPMCGNSVIESGELCDGNCPTSCDDNNACTLHTLNGSSASCNAVCQLTSTISTCTNSDGCCPTACDASNDNDCAVDCTNPASWPSNWSVFEEEVITLVNQYRASAQNCGVHGNFPAAQAVTMSPALRQAARCHSVDMGDNDNFSHTGTNGSSFSQRTSTAGYTGTPRGENIGAGYSTPAAVVTGWMNSDGHCRNIMNAQVNRMGIGYYYKNPSQWTRWWTMVTGTNGN